VVAQALRDAGLLGDRLTNGTLTFRAAARLDRAGPLHAGEFHFPAHARLRTVLDVLGTGRPVAHLLTIPEGLTAAQIARLLDAAEPLAGADSVPDEAGLLPQTYAFPRGTLRAAFLQRAAQALDRALDAGWAARAPDLPLGSPRDALILASLVERETAIADERPHVAAVFLNRLRLGMKLQSDPTVAYAATGGLGGPHSLSRADLDDDNPYNTYRHAGLPPGPICAPGLAAIQAVLRPARSDDLYFVADGTGGHVFAQTLADHERNVARWRALH
jgi:UPF0755 protein